MDLGPVTPRIVSVCGALAMLAIAYAFSRDRKRVDLRAVLWGVGLQWAFALLLLRVPAGRYALEGVGRAVQQVLDLTFAGSSFVFSDLGAREGGASGLGVVFAFQVLPTIVFIASLFSILYYLGIMQLVVRGLAWVMMRTMGTSGAESLSVAASVFMGQTEAPLTIRPYLVRLTESELFCVVVAGMASVSGAILAAYVAIGGVKMAHLLTVVAMTAPISLAIAKIIVPETGAPETAGDAPKLEEAESRNVFDAAADGASEGLKLALNVGAMLIAFIALVALVNLLLGLVPVDDPPTLERLLGWLFSPLAALMGVPWEDVPAVAEVLGTRTVINEIIAYQQLHELAPQLAERSRLIAAYAVCGFANLSSIGIQIGGLGAIVPSRKPDIARLGLLALLAATLANFSTACVAGALLPS